MVRLRLLLVIGALLLLSACTDEEIAAYCSQFPDACYAEGYPVLPAPLNPPGTN